MRVICFLCNEADMAPDSLFLLAASLMANGCLLKEEKHLKR